MSDFNLLKLKKFGKSSFSSIIGTIYYVWPIQTGDFQANTGNDSGSGNEANTGCEARPGSNANPGSYASDLNDQASQDRSASLDNISDLSISDDLITDSPGQTIFFLSNSEKSFDFFLNYLRNKFPKYCMADLASSEIEKELTGYLSGKTREISLEPAYLYGTDFEKKIWETTRKIRYGYAASYKEIAERAGYPNAFRAAGSALGNNPLMLVVPCHRVIRSNGEIGYFGGGEEIKLMLLDLEQPQQSE